MKSQGFSLLDLVIAMAIMGILASIAVPSFKQNVRKARRSDALQTLLEISQQQERFFFRNNRYSCNLQTAGELNRGTTNSLEGHYTMTMTPAVVNPCPNATAYTITHRLQLLGMIRTTIRSADPFHYRVRVLNPPWIPMQTIPRPNVGKISIFELGVDPSLFCIFGKV